MPTKTTTVTSTHPNKCGNHPNGPRCRYQSQQRQGEKERAGVRDVRCVFYIYLLHFLYQMFIYAKLSVWNEKTTTTTSVLTPQTTVNPSYVQSHYR